MKWLDLLKVHKCKTTGDIKTRWISIQAKKNHDPEILLEAKSKCKCGKEIVGYFSKEQLKETSKCK